MSKALSKCRVSSSGIRHQSYYVRDSDTLLADILKQNVYPKKDLNVSQRQSNLVSRSLSRRICYKVTLKRAMLGQTNRY